MELDHIVALAREFARNSPDTLAILTGDHTHGVSLIGTTDTESTAALMHDQVSVYDAAGLPDYQDTDQDGYPDSVDVKHPLAIFASNVRYYYETFGPKLDGPFAPVTEDADGNYTANEAYKTVPGAVLRVGNLPRESDAAVHEVEDVALQASRPASEALKGYMEQSDVYRVLANVLARGTVKK